MNKTMLYRLVAAVSAVVCLLIAWGVSAYESVKIHDIDAHIATTTAENAAASQLISNIDKRGAAGIISVARDSRHEQVQFVNQIRTLAEQNHIRFTHWSAGIVNPLPVPATADKQLKDLLGTVTPLCNELGVSGRYEDVRRFITSLTGSDRMIMVSRVKWNRNPKPPDTTLTFNATRYVSNAFGPDN